jgi:hypothetical protein
MRSLNTYFSGSYSEAIDLTLLNPDLDPTDDIQSCGAMPPRASTWPMKRASFAVTV